MEEWKKYRLGEVYDVRNGLSKGRMFFGSGYPFLSFKTVFNNYFLPPALPDLVQSNEKEQNFYDIKRGDVFVTRTSETPEELGMSSVALRDYPLATYNGFTKRLRPKDASTIYPEFIGYYLRSTKFRAVFYGLAYSMSTRASLSNGDLLEMRIFLPSLETQKSIATILKCLDDKIELNRKINSNLEEQAKALFKSWFIDFEPFKDGKFVDSELGKIPEGWDVVNLLDVSVLFDKRRKPLSGQQRQKMEKLYPYYGATSIMDYVDDYIFDGVYLLMGEDGSVVKSNGSPYLQYVYGKFWPNNHAHVMQGKNGYSTEMLWCLLDLTNVSSIVTGAVQGKISQQSMQKIKVPLPTQEVCDRFNIIINPIFAEIRLLSESSMRLSALRDTLLPKLMSGEIDVEHSKLLFI